MNVQYVSILGHQIDLSIAELERMFDAKNILRFGAVCLINAPVDAQILGGTPKVGHYLGEFNANVNLETLISNIIVKTSKQLSKISLGLSFYDYPIKLKDIHKLQLTIKKKVIKQNINLRFIPNKNLILNASQVWHNKLDKYPNIELLIIKHGTKLVLAKTSSIQNINAYTKRDRQKPFRDLKVGMLPPKLAQLLVNLSKLNQPSTVLDPFCGSGTILMEAALAGYNVIGSDISKRMVDGTNKNLQWLNRNFNVINKYHLFTGDATNFSWMDKIDGVVTETYLGQPISIFPTRPNVYLADSNKIITEFLHNLAKQINSGTPLVLAIPALFDHKNQEYHTLPLVDELTSLNYNHVEFKHVDVNRLFYRRPDQIVARHIQILTRS